MAALFSDRTPRNRISATPAAGALRPAASFLDMDEPAAASREIENRSGHRFDAELDVCELDERERPGLTWPAQAQELSRSHLVFRSRRMCYTGRRLLIAVHLIDDAPAPLCGRVTTCAYDSDGMYRVELEFARVPTWPDVAAWLAQRRPRC